MKRLVTTLVLAAAVATAGAANADGRSRSSGGGWQGNSGGWQGSSRGWSGGNTRGDWHGDRGWNGGNWHGSGWRGGHRSFVGVSLFAPFFWTAPWYPWGYYDPYYTYYDSYPAASYYVDRPVGYVVSETPPPAGAPGAAPQAAPAPSPAGRWYCPDQGYYPSVQTCSKGWLRVLPDAGPPR